MKRVILLVGLALLCAIFSLYAAAPDANTELHKIADVEVDSQFTANWEYVDSIIGVKTDTCYTLYTVSGVAILNPGEKLYVGLLDGGGDDDAAAGDTLIIACDMTQRGTVRVPFSFSYQDSLISQSSTSDTIYLTVAVGGSAATEKVTIEHLWFELRIIDTDDK